VARGVRPSTASRAAFLARCPAAFRGGGVGDGAESGLAFLVGLLDFGLVADAGRDRDTQGGEEGVVAPGFGALLLVPQEEELLEGVAV
jgi:hypothetical protein